MKTLVPAVLVLLGLAVTSLCMEGDSDDGPFSLIRGLRDVAESHSRLKRACSWWFKWKVMGANVDSTDVTTRLDNLFREVCNEYSKP